MRTIQRDVFARADLVRETVPKDQRGAACAWCGQEGRYRYGWMPDSVMQRTYNELSASVFCSVGCYRDYTS